MRMSAMKRLLLLFFVTVLTFLLTVTLISCGVETTPTEDTTAEAESTSQAPATTPITTEELVNGLPNYVDGNLFVIEDGKTNYRVTFAQGANKKPNTGAIFSDALSALRKAFRNYGFGSVTISSPL